MRLIFDNREIDYFDIRYIVSSFGEFIRENRLGEGSLSNIEVEIKFFNKRKRKDFEGEICEIKDLKRIKRDLIKFYSFVCLLIVFFIY